MVWPTWDPSAAASHQQHCWRAGHVLNGEVRLVLGLLLLLLEYHGGRHKQLASMGWSAEAVPTPSAEAPSHFFLFWGKVQYFKQVVKSKLFKLLRRRINSKIRT